MLIMLPFRHILTTTKSHSNKSILYRKTNVYVYGRKSTAFRQQLGYEIDFQSSGINAWKGQEHLRNTQQKYTTQVKPSWHIDKASHHIAIIHLSRNFDLVFGLQTFHKLVCTINQKATHTHNTHTRTHARTHTHANTSARAHARTHPHTHTHTPTHPHTHTHTHTHTPTHTHTQNLVDNIHDVLKDVK